MVFNKRSWYARSGQAAAQGIVYASFRGRVASGSREDVSSPVVWYGMQCNAWKGQISSLMSAQLYRGMRDDMQPSRIEAAARHVLVAKMDDQMNKET